MTQASTPDALVNEIRAQLTGAHNAPAARHDSSSLNTSGNNISMTSTVASQAIKLPSRFSRS